MIFRFLLKMKLCQGEDLMLPVSILLIGIRKPWTSKKIQLMMRLCHCWVILMNYLNKRMPIKILQLSQHNEIIWLVFFQRIYQEDIWFQRIFIMLTRTKLFICMIWIILPRNLQIVVCGILKICFRMEL